jgi:hypothetical protein
VEWEALRRSVMARARVVLPGWVWLVVVMRREMGIGIVTRAGDARDGYQVSGARLEVRGFVCHGMLVVPRFRNDREVYT